MWHGLLRATGGDHVPEKCFWYLIAFQWINKQWKYKKTSELPGQISIDHPKGHIVIPWLEPDKARRTLGMRIAPDGNDAAEAQYLTEVAAAWGNHMARAHLTRTEAEFSLQQVLAPKLNYPLIATNFDEQQCHEILKPALGQALPAMGLNRHFPQAVTHGPRSHHGLDVPNLFTEQLVAHILMLNISTYSHFVYIMTGDCNFSRMST